MTGRGKEDMGKEKEQRGGKTNVRHTLYIKGLRQTPSIMVSYEEQQFSLQVVDGTSSSAPREYTFNLSLYSTKSFQRAVFCRPELQCRAVNSEHLISSLCACVKR